MKWGARLLIRLYRLLLTCYPATFRARFGVEMLDVFRSGLEEGKPWLLFWREFWHWPGAVLQAHMHARRKQMTSDGYAHIKPLTRIELLAAMVIFLLPLFSLVGITGVGLPVWMNYVLLTFFWGCILLALGVGIAKKLPGWSLSYLGFLLIIGLVFSPILPRMANWAYPYFLEAFGMRSRWPVSVSLLYAGIFEFIAAFQILFGALVLVNLLRLFPYTRVVWERIRADWTQLSFLIYGGLVFAITLVFEEYRYDDLWKFAAWTFLAAGAWIYLRARKEKQRIISLLVGMTAAFWTVALAKWILIPLQMWPTGYPDAPSVKTRWVEMGNTLLSWLFFLWILCAPALLKWLPPLPTSTPIGEDNPASSQTL